MCKHPAFGCRLALARLRFFFTRRFQGTIRTPDTYLIQSEFELIAYWSFFVERECWSDAWIGPLFREDSPTVLDVGANAGLFTHLIWTLKPSARLFAFDPLPEMARKISRWGKDKAASITVVNKAVAAKPGTATFYTGSPCDTTASLVDDGSNKNGLQVEATTLDEIIPDEPIFLIKIDVEGAETAVIAGASRTLTNTRFLIIEAHHPEALSEIALALGKKWSSQQIGESDYLFIRQ